MTTTLLAPAPPRATDSERTDQAPPPRVLMVSARYRPYVGGTETHLAEVAPRLAAGDERAVTILTTDPSGALPSCEREASGVLVGRVRAWPSRGPLNDFHIAPGLAGFIGDGRRWELLHLQGYHTVVAPLALRAARRAGLPYVVSFHSGGRGGGLRGLIREAQLASLRPLLAGARRLIAVSRFEAAYFARRLKLPAARFVVIPNGVSLPDVPSGPATATEAGPLLVSTGRLERYKGHHLAIGALPHLLPHYPDIRLRIVGSGPYEGELRALAARLGVAARVEIAAIPATDRAAMAGLLRRAALVLSLSTFESQGIGVGEAIALGRPALVAHAAALAELVERGLAHGTPPDGTPEGTARAILAALATPLAPAPGAALPTWDDCAASLAALYRREVAALAATRR